MFTTRPTMDESLPNRFFQNRYDSTATRLALARSSSGENTRPRRAAVPMSEKKPGDVHQPMVRAVSEPVRNSAPLPRRYAILFIAPSGFGATALCKSLNARYDGSRVLFASICSSTIASSPTFRYGSARSSTPSTMDSTLVTAPIPSASVITAAAEYTGARRSDRRTIGIWRIIAFAVEDNGVTRLGRESTLIACDDQELRLLSAVILQADLPRCAVGIGTAKWRTISVRTNETWFSAFSA